MKDNTKNLIVAAGIAAAGLYVVTTMGDDGDGYGFAGGGGGVPLLPQLEEAAGAGGDTIINIPPPITDSPFAGWGDMPATGDTDDIPSMKKVAAEPAFVFGGATRSPSPTAGFGGGWGEDAESIANQITSGKSLQDASNNVGLWLLGTKGNVVNKRPVSQQAGLTKAVKIITSKKVVTINEATKGGIGGSSGSSRSRGFSTMPKGGTPGWKQVGAKKPTAPGQPDR